MKNKPFTVANVREILEIWGRDKITDQEMVEMLNDVAEKFYTEQYQQTIKPMEMIINLESLQDVEEPKGCHNCNYYYKLGFEDPCVSCNSDFDKWEPSK